MATGIGPGTNFSNNTDPGEGILGNLYNKATRARFNREIWGTGNNDGVLQSSLKDMEELQKELIKISKDKENFDNKSIKKAKELLNLLKDQKFLTEKMINIGEASDSEALARAKELRNVELDTLQRVKKLIQENSKISEEEREKSNAFYLNEMQKFKNLGNQVNKLEKDLSKGTSNTIKSIGNSISGVGDKLAQLSNMFNLDKIANNAFEQSARSKLSIQNQLTKQYGMNISQFNTFRSAMFGNLSGLNAATGNLFSGNDMLDYLQKLDKYNITNTKIAEQQMKSSIMATKYLSVSDETQTNIFKFMKATNDYTMLDKHNQTITGLLKSQLGVSTQQLDQITQLVQSTQDVQFASGMSVDAMNKYQESSTVLASVLSSQLGDSYAKSITSVLGKMVSASYSDMPELVQAYGVTYDDIRRLQETGDVYSIYNKLLSSSGYSRYNIGSVAGTNEVIQQLGGDVGVIGAMRASTGKESQIQKEYMSAINNIKNGTQSIESYLQETTATTLTEKLQNQMSVFFGDIDWRYTVGLANLAFTSMLVGNIFKGIGTLADVFKSVNNAGGIGGLIKNSISSVGIKETLMNGGITVGLTSAAITALGITIASSVNVSKYGLTDENTREAVWSSEEVKNKGTLASLGHQMSTGYGTVGNAYVGMFASLIGNKQLKAKANFSQIMGDMANYFHGENEEDALLWRLATLMLFDKGDTLGFLGVDKNHSDLVSAFKSLDSNQKAKLKHYASQIQSNLLYYAIDREGNKVPLDSIDWNNYHKAGLNFVPKENYKALLHKGEMVLNARQAEQYRRSMGIDRYGNGYGGSLSPSASDYVGPHHSGYAGHNGIDLYFGDIGTPVGSAVSGKVIVSKDIPVNWNDGKSYHGKDSNGNAYSSYGRYVKVLGDDGRTYIYAHLNERAVNSGDIVSAGTLLGYSGTTGNSSGPHLHFEVVGAGTGEANHAKYYTPYVRNVLGTASKISSSSLVGLSNPNAESTVKVTTRKFIPKIFSNGSGGGDNSADRITNSVDGGFRNLISYLESIRAEQDSQRAILEAFSNSRLS